ncbi:MAG TPA: nucleotide sugar dehydrogenase [Chitinophagaceae bacterium]|nr:nucleotide sugar dehydrogenase [Chitinophagaceae bacterium]
MKRIAIAGFGKIGQALAANMLRHTDEVVINAIDNNAQLVAAFEDGSWDTGEPGVKEILQEALQKSRLSVSSSYQCVADCAAVIVAIPLLVGKSYELLDQDFKNCIREIASLVQHKCTIIMETSVPVGYCRQQILPVLEEQGKEHGRDFWLAYSPERIKSGSMLLQLTAIPKIIGGISREAGEAAMKLYAPFFPSAEVVLTESAEAAEMVKLAGMIYRDVNIALSNQLAIYSGAAGLPFTDLISLVNTDREANLLYPGIGVGGHCTPVYPYFLIENFRQQGLDFSLAKLGREINRDMPAYAVSLVKDRLRRKKALILGLGFRPDVKEDTLSVTYSLAALLAQEGIQVAVHDTVFSPAEIQAKGLAPVADIYSSDAEVIFLVTMHSQYRDIDFRKLKQQGVEYMVDGRNSLDRHQAEAAGLTVFGIGS